MKIMVIDDDAGSLRGMITALTLLGHDCDAFDNPEAAYSNFIAGKYGAVIADLWMQPIDGIQLMTAIHALNPILPAVLVSGCADRHWAGKAIEKGAFAFLAKPVDAREISEVLDRIEKETQIQQCSSLGD